MTNKEEQIRQVSDRIINAVAWGIFWPRIIALALMAIGFFALANLGD